MRDVLKTGVLWLLMIACSSCASRREEGDSRGAITELADPANALTEELMLSLGQAKNFHHKANVFASDGNIDDAANEVQKILAIAFPPNSPEAEDVQLDARARLAKFRLLQGRLDDAVAVVDKGLSGNHRSSFFLANLHTVRGEIFEARAALAEQGSDASRDSKIDAIKSFDMSIQINNQLLKELEIQSKNK